MLEVILEQVGFLMINLELYSYSVIKRLKYFKYASRNEKYSHKIFLKKTAKKSKCKVNQKQSRSLDGCTPLNFSLL